MSAVAAVPAWLAPYTYVLPSEQIALRPPDARDGARLLRLSPGSAVDAQMRDFAGLLRPGDLLVLNNTQVLSARLRARRATGGAVEILLLEGEGAAVPALLRPSRRIKVGEVLGILDHAGEAITGMSATVGHVQPSGRRLVVLKPSPEAVMAAAGRIPLPPYINREAEDSDQHRYQTVFAQVPGAVAAPTAGLHFTEAMLAQIEAMGVELATVTLHVGPGTFQSLRAEDIERGRLHSERCSVPQATADAVRSTRQRGGRVIAVGTTVTRTLESRAIEGGLVQPGSGATDLFIRPGYRFEVVDGLLTNFHLPSTSLLMLVCAMGGRDLVMDGYAHAVASGYRFYSYGDAMFLTGFSPERTR